MSNPTIVSLNKCIVRKERLHIQ